MILYKIKHLRYVVIYKNNAAMCGGMRLIMNEIKEISIPELMKAMLKKWWIIVLAALLGAIIAFAYTQYMVVPTYETTAKLGVHTTDDSTSAVTDANFGYVLSRDCADVITGNVVLGDAADKLNEYSFPENDGKKYREYNAEVLATMVTAKSSEESKFFSITVTSIYPEEAKIVADMIIEAFCEDIAAKADGGKDLLAKGGADGNVVHEPVVPSAPSSPNKVLNILIGFAAGVALSCAIIVVLHFTNNRLQSEEWILSAYGEAIPLLAVIPDTSSTKYKEYRYNEKYYSKKKKV